MKDRELKKKEQLRKLEAALTLSAGLLALDSGLRSVIPIFNLTIIGIPIAITLFALSRAIHLHSNKSELINVLEHCKFFVLQFYKFHISNISELSIYMKHILSIGSDNSSKVFTYQIDSLLLEKLKDSFTIINILLQRVVPNKYEKSYIEATKRFYNRNFSAKFYRDQLKKELLILIGLFNIYQIKFDKIKEMYRNDLQSHGIDLLDVENEIYSSESYQQTLETIDVLRNLQNNPQIEQQKKEYEQEITSKESTVHDYLIEENKSSTTNGGRKSKRKYKKYSRKQKKILL